jgi:RNA polymerase sigma-70 factor (family 1)
LISTTAYNEKTLLLHVAKGDEKAFEKLYTTHIDFIYRFILKFVKSPELAEDLTQETFIKIWESEVQLADVRSFKDYLFIAARNNAFNFLKRASRENIAKGEILRHYQQPVAEESLDRLVSKNYMEFIQEVLDSLPAQTRQIFLLCREQNKSYDEVATLMGISRNTVKKHMVRSNKTFTNLLGRSNLPLLLSAYFILTAGI